MKVPSEALHRDEEGNEFVEEPQSADSRRVFKDANGRRYVRRDRTSRVLAAIVGVVMLGYGLVAVTAGLSLPLHLQYVGAAAWMQGTPIASLILGLFAGAIGIGVLWTAITGIEGVYLTGARDEFDPRFDEDSPPSWEFGRFE